MLVVIVELNPTMFACDPFFCDHLFFECNFALIYVAQTADPLE